MLIHTCIYRKYFYNYTFLFYQVPSIRTPIPDYDGIITVMQREETKKPRVRFTRNPDGSIGAPRDVSGTSDDLIELWGKQSASLELPRLSIKQELSQLKKTFAHPRKNKSNNRVQASLKKSSQVAQLSKKLPAKGAVAPVAPPRPITISISIPALRIPKRLSAHKKKPIMLSGIAILVAVTALFVIVRLNNSNDGANNGEVQGAVTTNISTNVTPSFPVLTPNGSGVADLGGFANIAPKDAPPVYAYTDAIGDKKIKVSQQQLPDTLRADQATKLKDLAEGFNAKTPLEIGDNTAYIGASAKGAQSIVYIKGENLVLIASDDTISNSDWVTYIGSLKY
jgi:hypothetical protein